MLYKIFLLFFSFFFLDKQFGVTVELERNIHFIYCFRFFFLESRTYTYLYYFLEKYFHFFCISLFPLLDYTHLRWIQFQEIILPIWMALARELIWISDPSSLRVVWILLLQPSIWFGHLCLHYTFSLSMFLYLLLEVGC